MKSPRSCLQRRPGPRLSLLLVLAATGCVPRAEPEPVPPPRPEAPAAPSAAAEPVARNVPYEGALPPGDPPDTPLPPSQKPVEPSVKAALDVWWERPSPRGPEPIPLAQPKAIYVTGNGPVIQALPGPPAFPDKIPEYLRTVMPEKIPYSNNVQRLPRGEIRLVAYDNTHNDTKLSRDSMEVEISFVDGEGAEWRIEQVVLAPISPNPVAEPWFGGLVIDTLYHGSTGNGTPAEPLVNCALCSWGWADIYKDGKRVASSALLHVMLTSDTRGDDLDYQCYECADNPVREVHVVVPPREYLPAPGGFLHVMWENAEVQRGTPQQVQAMAPKLGESLPTIELSAVPHLTWDQEEIRVRAGQRYRLIVHNNDPVSLHQFYLHSMPESAENPEQPADLRHEESGFAGGVGPLWRPGQQGHHGGGDPPAPASVFFPLPQGSTWATVVEFEQPGEYSFMCPVGNHKMRGMKGKFIVTAGDGAERERIPVRKEGAR